MNVLSLFDGISCGRVALQRANIIDQDLQRRYLTPIECERLQTLDDRYTEGVSKTQRYRCLGNSWTVDIIVHILNFIKERL